MTLVAELSEKINEGPEYNAEKLKIEEIKEGAWFCPREHKPRSCTHKGVVCCVNCADFDKCNDVCFEAEEWTIKGVKCPYVTRGWEVSK